MPQEVGLWRVGEKPVRLHAGKMPTERQLEDLIEHDPAILGEPLLLIGRQVPTDYGKFIDLLAVDAEGVLHVLELKKDRTPREVVAQLLDYGSWVRTLTHQRVLDIFASYARDKDVAFEAAFEERFHRTAPDDLNTSHRLTIIASELDAATERIVNYLVDPHNVPINAVFFAYFEDGDRKYLARSWLIDQDRVADAVATPQTRTSEPWNGRNWYVSFGDEEGGRSWEDARKYGFVSAGGGEWYSNTIRKLPVGARVFAYIPKAGYVGVGEVTGEATPFDEAVLTISGLEQRLASLPLEGRYVHADGEEWFVPVAWQETRPRSHAFKVPGLFANQNSAARLRNKFTLDALAHEFDLDEA